MTLDQLRTPAVLVHRPRLLANIDRMQTAADARGVRLRPHAKTHKSPQIARWQIARGAVGVCCAKLGEAEVFAEAGIADIRLPYPINPVNADRVEALLDRTRLSFIVDHLTVAGDWSRAIQGAGRQVDVLVKVDVGFHRCGISPDVPPAVEFLQRVADMPGLRLRGLLAHAGQSYHASSEAELQTIARDEAAMLEAIARAARDAGIQLDEISVGATPPVRFSLQVNGITELRPGNYVYFDRTQVGLGAATFDDCALSVLATVVSRPAGDRLILDCGSKTLTSDAARGFMPLPGHGVVFDDVLFASGQQPDSSLIVERLSEEHATVAVTGNSPLRPGDRVRVLPNHACVVSNLVDQVWLTDEDGTVEALPVAARGKIQ